MIIDKAGFEFLWPGDKLTLGKVIELNDHRAVIVGISDASAPFTTFPVVYTKYSNAMNYIGRTRKQMSFVLARAQAAARGNRARHCSRTASYRVLLAHCRARVGSDRA